jgi:hypothetical protein
MTPDHAGDREATGAVRAREPHGGAPAVTIPGQLGPAARVGVALTRSNLAMKTRKAGRMRMTSGARTAIVAVATR